MITFITFLLILDVVVLAILVLVLQNGNEGGVGSAFGGGNTQGFFGASGGVGFIVNATWIAGLLFFGLSLLLVYQKNKSGHEISSSLKKISESATPAVKFSPTVMPVVSPTTVASPNVIESKVSTPTTR